MSEIVPNGRRGVRDAETFATRGVSQGSDESPCVILDLLTCPLEEHGGHASSQGHRPDAAKPSFCASFPSSGAVTCSPPPPPFPKLPNK